MSKQTINVGTTANDKKGDSLRAAFQKVNSNFTELYTALGLAADVNLNLGAFEFSGSVMTTTDSTPITIGQDVTITSGLTVSGDIIPASNLISNLGSSTNKFHSIYVGTGSVYLGDAKLSLENGRISSNVGFDLTDSIGVVNGTVSWADVTSKPSMFDIGGNIIGIASSDIITEESISGTVSQITDVESQIEVGADSIVITKGISQTVDDGVTTTVDSVSSTIEVLDTGVRIKKTLNPAGPNNNDYTELFISNDISLKKAQELIGGEEAYSAVNISDSAVQITTNIEGVKTWLFDSSGELIVPEAGTISGTNDLSLRSIVGDTSSGLFLNGNPNVGSAVLYANTVATIRTDNNGTPKDWSFDKSGTITTPLLLPKVFTAVLDESHMDSLTALSDTAWEYVVEFAVNPDGTVMTQMDDPVRTVNPGYADGKSFTFTEADHGIPGYTFNLLLQTIINDGGNYVAQVAVSPPPEYPSTISSLGAIKVTSDTNSWTFGTDGKLKLPVSGDIVDSTGTSVLGGNASTGQVGFSGNVMYNSNSTNEGLYIAPGGESTSYTFVPGNSQSDNTALQIVNTSSTGQVYIAANNNQFIFNYDGGLTLPSLGFIKQNNSYTRTINSNSVSAGSGTVIWTSVVDYISSAKLVIQVECNEAGDDTGWHSQSCEAIVASRGYANGFGGPGGDPAMTVYGVTYTSIAPLVTFTAQRNPTTKNVEVVGTLTGTASGTASIKIYSVEMTTRD